MAEEVKCEKCGKEFDSERGLSIHSTRMHEDNTEEEEPDTEEKKKQSWDIKIPKPSFGGGKPLVAVFLLGLILGFGTGYISPDIGTLLPEEDPEVDISKIDNSNDPVLGNKDAEVTIAVYEDFECPFCRRFEQQTVPRIKENYIDSGQVKIVWKDFPLERIHPWARKSSETMECVYRQDEEAFWSVKDKIFSNQKTLNVDNIEENIINWATAEGVSEKDIQSCLENGNPTSAVNKDLREGQSFDINVGGSPFVSGTPAAVIYSESDEKGDPIVGAQPYSRFKTVIDSNLE